MNPSEHLIVLVSIIIGLAIVHLLTSFLRLVRARDRVNSIGFRQDKTAIKHNDFLTLEGIPEHAHRYRLGNRLWLGALFEIKRATIFAGIVI